MKILVTGARGFIGRNLVAELKNRTYTKIYKYHTATDPALLDVYCQKADFVYHLAGVNRPKEQSAFMKGNYGFTSTLLSTLKKHRNYCPIIFASSIQAGLNNPYGRSKKAAEDLMFSYSNETGAKVMIYRFANVFGKWSKPNYNSVVATFCHNIARDLPITVNDPKVLMELVYIDDVVEELINALNGKANQKGNFFEVPVKYTVSLGKIADLIYSFKNCRENLFIPDLSDDLIKNLHSTYLSYLPDNEFSYTLKTIVDNRGSFTEFLKSADRGQVSVNISKPGITKGNHWHHTKSEKFLVVSGRGVIRFRQINAKEIIEYHVSGDKLEVVDVPVGYTHNIENLGEGDMVTVMWANEVFDPDKPDTYHMEV